MIPSGRDSVQRPSILHSISGVLDSIVSVGQTATGGIVSMGKTATGGIVSGLTATTGAITHMGRDLILYHFVIDFY